MPTNPLPLPPAEYLMECLDYDRFSGLLTWKKRPRTHFSSHTIHKRWNTRYSGRQIGATIKNGYIVFGLNGKTLLAHRVAWKIYYGEDPPKFIDHANTNKKDNRIENLRAATLSQNAHNVPKRKGTVSTHKGVYRDRTRWTVQIRVNGVLHYVGKFKDRDVAAAAYRVYARSVYGEFFNPGK